MMVNLADVVKAYQQLERWLREGAEVELAFDAPDRIGIVVSFNRRFVTCQAETLALAVERAVEALGAESSAPEEHRGAT